MTLEKKNGDTSVRCLGPAVDRPLFPGELLGRAGGGAVGTVMSLTP